MKYTVEDTNLVIRIPLAAIMANALIHSDAVAHVVDSVGLAMALGQELIDAENISGEPHLNGVLDSAMERVIEGAHPSLEYTDNE